MILGSGWTAKRLVFRNPETLARIPASYYTVIDDPAKIAEVRAYYERLMALPVGERLRQQALDNLWTPSDERTVLVAMDAQ